MASEMYPSRGPGAGSAREATWYAEAWCPGSVREALSEARHGAWETQDGKRSASDLLRAVRRSGSVQRMLSGAAQDQRWVRVSLAGLDAPGYRAPSVGEH